MPNSPSPAGLPPPPVAPPIRWSARTRAVVSVLVGLHVVAILVGPLSVPPTILGGLAGTFFRPYLQAAYLGNAYKFFGPDPEASHLVRYDVELADGKHVEGTLPDRKQHWPRLLYHRYFMLSEFLMKLDASARPDLPWEKQPLAPLAIAYWRSYGEHLLHQHRARRVTLYLVEHELPMPGQVREGMRLDDPRLYHTRKLGTIEGDAS